MTSEIQQQVMSMCFVKMKQHQYNFYLQRVISCKIQTGKTKFLIKVGPSIKLFYNRIHKIRAPHMPVSFKKESEISLYLYKQARGVTWISLPPFLPLSLPIHPVVLLDDLWVIPNLSCILHHQSKKPCLGYCSCPNARPLSWLLSSLITANLLVDRFHLLKKTQNIPTKYPIHTNYFHSKRNKRSKHASSHIYHGFPFHISR